MTKRTAIDTAAPITAVATPPAVKIQSIMAIIMAYAVGLNTYPLVPLA